MAVTERSVQALSPSQLEAVLAHELGHHFGGHTWASLLRYWYSFPALYTLRSATYLNLALLSALGSGSVATIVVVAVGVVSFVGVLLVDTPVVGTAVAVVFLLPFPVLWLKRSQEHQADSTAVHLGYGTELAANAAQHLSCDGGPSRPLRALAAQLGASHPEDAERAQRIQGQLDASGPCCSAGPRPGPSGQ